jgi:peptidoglycan/LPS O-acetylase OafA/YrhL
MHDSVTVMGRDMPATDGAKRIDALGSLRGIAAAVVVFGHTALASGIPGVPVHWAVMLFFVLSGFVLALPWGKDDRRRGPSS